MAADSETLEFAVRLMRTPCGRWGVVATWDGEATPFLYPTLEAALAQMARTCYRAADTFATAPGVPAASAPSPFLPDPGGE